MKTIEKVCLRCDWEGETKAPTCPSCGTALWIARPPGEPRGRRWRGPSSRRQRRPRGPRADPEPLVAPEVEPAPALPSHPDVVRDLPPEELEARRSPRERRRALVAGLVVGAVAIVAVVVIQAGTPSTPNPTAQAIGGRLVYAIEDDADPSFHRIWIYDMSQGTLSRGPQLSEPIQLVRASDVSGDAVASISRTDDGFSADLLRFLAPTDRAVSVLEDEQVAWSPGGEAAFGASVLPGCTKIELHTWAPVTALAYEQFVPCGDLLAVAATDRLNYVGAARAGPPVIDVVARQYRYTGVIGGYLPVGASGSDVLVIEADGANDADVGPALFVWSPDRPGAAQVGGPSRSFAFEALLAPGTGVLGDLVLGTFEGVRGIFRLEATDTIIKPVKVLETAAAVVGATATEEGDVIAYVDGKLLAIRGKVVSDLALPEDAPAAGPLLLWLPTAVPAEPA